MSVATVRLIATGLALVLIAGPAGYSQVGAPAGAPGGAPATNTKVMPKLEPVAETKLIMDGLAHTNFRGLERILTQEPADVQAWKFARGQALLLAETGNLLMLRPPKNQGQPLWFERAAELRKQATQLALTLSKRDYAGSRAGLQQLAGSCNRCHRTFQVDAEITPFPAPPPPKVE
jgi:hypothetical protein